MWIHDLFMKTVPGLKFLYGKFWIRNWENEKKISRQNLNYLPFLLEYFD